MILVIFSVENWVSLAEAISRPSQSHSAESNAAFLLLGSLIPRLRSWDKTRREWERKIEGKAGGRVSQTSSSSSHQAGQSAEGKGERKKKTLLLSTVSQQQQQQRIYLVRTEPTRAGGGIFFIRRRRSRFEERKNERESGGDSGQLSGECPSNAEVHPDDDCWSGWSAPFWSVISRIYILKVRIPPLPACWLSHSIPPTSPLRHTSRKSVCDCECAFMSVCVCAAPKEKCAANRCFWES